MTENDIEELWKPIGTHEGYEVSNQGRVRSLSRIVVTTRSTAKGLLTIERRYSGRILKPQTVDTGHLAVGLGAGPRHKVHHLVLTEFVGPRPSGMWGLHEDDDPANNRLENLYWGTPAQNFADAVQNALRFIGEHHHNAKLTESAVREIKRALITETVAAVARRYEVSAGAIKSIRAGLTWAHLDACADLIGVTPAQLEKAHSA